MSLCLAAAALTFGLNTVSYHTDTSAHYNTNPGVYVQYGSVAAGTYYNSERNQSTWGAYVFTSESCRYDLMVGLVTGYKSPVLPMLVPSVKFAITDDMRLRLSVMPTSRDAKKLDGAVFHASFERPF